MSRRVNRDAERSPSAYEYRKAKNLVRNTDIVLRDNAEEVISKRLPGGDIVDVNVLGSTVTATVSIGIHIYYVQANYDVFIDRDLISKGDFSKFTIAQEVNQYAQD